MRRREFLKTGAALPMLATDRGLRRNCIFLMLTGGPSQLDTWDMKPDASRDIRGPFQPINTNVPGIQISEIFPGMARLADKYALVRSVYHDGPAIHEVGTQLIRTGSSEDAPCTGEAVAEVTGSEHVVLSGRFTDNCIKASRLVASGTRFVTVNMFDSIFGEKTWDSHGSKPFSSLQDYSGHVGRVFDAAYSALLIDLERRGILDRTLVVASGEFGRNPKINPSGGRDHWPQCWTVVMAGGGVRGGQIYGSSDRIGAEPRDNPVHASSIAATIYWVMGVQPASELKSPPLTQLFG